MTTAIQKRKYEIVIVGAGIVGCSTAYHLAKMGCTDVAVIDRGSVNLPLGSTGHAPGLLGRNSASSDMAAFADYTGDLLSSVPADSPALSRVGNLEVARDDTRMAELERKKECATRNGLRASMVSPVEMAELVPYMDTSSLIGGMLVPDDGTLDAKTALRSLRDFAVQSGVTFIENTEVTGFKRQNGKVVGATTSQGVFEGDKVLVAVGIWGNAMLQTLDIHLPLHPVQHPYAYTESLPFLRDQPNRKACPMVRDLDNVFYLREHGDKLGFGWYNHRSRTVDVTGIQKADIGFPGEGFLDQLKFDLFPFLKHTQLEKKINGIFSMTPDGNPLLGPVDGAEGLYVAEAVWVTHSGGVGKAMADYLLGVESKFRISQFAPSRFDKLGKAEQRESALDLYNNIYRWSENK